MSVKQELCRADGRRVRVAFLDSTSALSGGEVALLRMLPPLLDAVDVTVVLAEPGLLADRLQTLGVEVVVLPLHESARNAERGSASSRGLHPRATAETARHVVQLSRLLRTLDIDVVHTNNLKSALYGGLAGRLAHRPVVWHVRDRISGDYLPPSTARLVRAASRVLPDAVVANSVNTLATLPPHAQGSVVFSPIATRDWVPPRPRRAADGDDLVIGMVGRLSSWKGQDLFLRAFAQAFRGTGARARLIGSAMFDADQEWQQFLEQLVDVLGIADQVEFRGFREDVWQEYADLDLAVHSSRLPEPFGKVVLEAMAAGVPVVAADEAGPAEVVTDGEDGLLVPPRDVAALAAALRRLATDAPLRARLRAGGLLTAAEYTPELAAEQLLEVYRRVLA